MNAGTALPPLRATRLLDQVRERLRLKDVDFDRGLVVVREGKGNKDRITMLPRVLVGDLQKQLAYARSLLESDRALKRPGVETPPGVARKYPRAAESWSWFWVLPADYESVDPRSRCRRRHHLYEGTLDERRDALRCSASAWPVSA